MSLVSHGEKCYLGVLEGGLDDLIQMCRGERLKLSICTGLEVFLNCCKQPSGN